MIANLGPLQRAARLLLGALVVLAPIVTEIALFQSTGTRVAATALGLVLIGTSAVKFCPLYRVLGLRTCKVQ